MSERTTNMRYGYGYGFGLESFQSMIKHAILFFPFDYFTHFFEEWESFIFCSDYLSYLVVKFVLQILETAFKKETVGLVTREEYVEKVVF